MRTWQIAKSTLKTSIACGALLAGATGCAQSVGDIDRTQPELVPKDAFEGQWYVRQTVVDVPPTSAGSFTGEMHSLEVVVWEVQEDTLVGYRAYEKVPGTEAEVEDSSGIGRTEVVEGQGEGFDKTLFKGNPIVAFTISNHVDVQRDYNPRTGEQTNVIVENTSDRPWHERDWMRVDWSDNVVDNLLHKSGFMFGDSNRKEFIPEEEGGDDAFRMEENEDGELNYVDFTERHFVTPNMFGCLSSLWQNGIGDCTDSEIKVRTSMLKVDVEREQDYEPMAYDDRRHGEFGYFRTIRPVYDRGHGSTWTALQQFANRHEIWADNRNDDGQLKSYKDRKLRPVVYHLSKNYPDDLVETAEKMAAEYDKVLKDVAAAARGQDFEALVADVKEDTGGSCLFCLDHNEDGEARIGDLRYNFIYWVDDPQMIGPLGYGPSSAHPETGRIVSSTAYVYGAGVDRYRQFAKDIIDGLNGKLDQEDLIGFEYVKNAVRTGLRGIDQRVAEDISTIPLDETASKILGQEKIAKLEMFKEMGPDMALPEHAPGFEQMQVRAVEGTQFEALMIPAEMETHFDPSGYFEFKLGDQISYIEDTSVPSVSHWGTKQALEQLDELQLFASQNNIWLQDFSDPAIVGLARKMQNEGLDDEALKQELRESVYRAVMLHEIGHTMGLRHNFGGSADPMNYHDEYWEQRAKTLPQAVSGGDLSSITPWLRSNCSVQDSVNQEACKEQEDGRMAEYQYSSIMDYGSRFNSDLHGLGKWDRAALASAYGNLVEVFDEDVAARLDPQVREAIQRANYRFSPVRSFGQGLQNALDVHYTDLPDLLGGVENLGKRKWIPRNEWNNSDENGPLKVPYMSCYDEYVDAVESCHRWDHGADAYEIVADYIQRYKEYYVFNNFQRDRIGFSGLNVLTRVMQRYMLPVTNMYQHWLFNAFGRSQNTPQAVLGLIATQEGFQTLWNVVATPNYGSYVLENGMYRYVSDDYRDDNGNTDLQIAPGEGRRPYSRFDLDSGYNVYQRVLESGHFYDQIGALIALTSFDASIVGVGSDVQADVLRYSIPYYLIFNEELNRLFSAGFRRSYSDFAPRVVNNELVRPSVFTLLSEQEMDDEPAIETSLTFTARIQLLIRSMALFKSNYDTEFLQMAHIAIEGSGEDRMPAPGFEAVRAYNPVTGRAYVAYRPEDPARHQDGWLGADLVTDLAEVVAEWEAAPEDEKASIEFSISDKARDIEIARGLYEVFQNAVL